MESKELQTILASEAMILDSKVNLDGKEIHYLDLEWYELNSGKLTRETDHGLKVQIRKSSNHVYQDHDLIYIDSEKIIRIRLKPCDCIVISSQNLNEVGQVSFAIGNQHLPIFLNQEDELLLAYDGKSYQMLSSFGFQIRIEQKSLHPHEMIKAYGNYLQ
ncbi:urease accessory protein UreE [Pararhodonellum marinum]|uniref:hypothetical protein n=1 Tax=Pararhodonellum marinum TaxID=2755358 RepID=UPI00188F8B43|nr:hypothetical protein [Pararhodonellum marinum]